MTDLAQILGWTATVLFSVMIIPQMVKTIKIKDTRGVSLFLFIIFLIANIVALIYALLISQKPLIIKYILAIITTTFYIGLYTVYLRREKVKEREQIKKTKTETEPLNQETAKKHPLGWVKQLEAAGLPTVLWFTGLSGAGKTTLANELSRELANSGKTVEVLDGDVVREKLHANLGFSREDIRENNRLIAEMARKSTADVVLVPIISPYQEDRKMAREVIGPGFKEIFINAPLQECINRDVKGLYKKALAGEITNFIGVADSNPYEAPDDPDLQIRTDQETVKESVKKLMDNLLR